MKTTLLTILFSIFCLNAASQIKLKDITKIGDKTEQVKDSVKKNIIYLKPNEQEATWDNGIPLLPEDDRVMKLLDQLDTRNINDVKSLSKEQVRVMRELGLEFYNKGMYQEADFYLSKIKNYTESKHIPLKEIFTENPNEIRQQIREEIEQKYQVKADSPQTQLSQSEVENLEKDKEFLKALPQKLEEVSKQDLEKLSQQLESQIQKLMKEKEELIKNKGSQQAIDLKDNSIKSLKKEKQVVELSIDKEQLKEEKAIIKRWLWGTAAAIAVLILSIFVIIQRKTIKIQDGEIESQLKDIAKKNTYLEHAARIIRHDMHSGINTYIPRGITSLEKRITPEEIQNLKIDAPLKMIKEGLNHTQKVYKSVYEFTNLVKQDVVLDKKDEDLTLLLRTYFDSTSYGNQVQINELPTLAVNPVLFSNAIDNLVKNGLKYNKNETKWVKIYQEAGSIVVQDNGTGLTQKQFEKISIDFLTRESKDLDKEISGLGLNICQTILSEHGFTLTCEKNDIGTKMVIKTT